MKTCPFCAESIQDQAVKCRYCGSMLAATAPAVAMPTPQHPAASAALMPIAGTGVPARAPEMTYFSSRWSRGNLFFRDSLTLAGDGIMYRKGALFRSRQEHINYRSIASVRILKGWFMCALSIETSGGSQPIVVHGIWRSHAKAIQDAVRGFQARG